METLIVQPKNKKQLEAVKAFLRALDISFKKETQSLYNPEFVAKIERSRQQIKGGYYVTIDQGKSLWESIL